MEVAECEFKGGHQYDGGIRLPVRQSMPSRVPTIEEATTPQPVKYWLVQQCRRCGYEKKTPHGFVPTSQRTNPQLSGE